jgi:hypothetical protein
MPSDESQACVSARSREFHASLASACLPRIDNATVPILGIQDDQFRHDRTGVLYRVAGHHFVLTAAHDLRKIVELNIPLYLSVNVAGVGPLPLADVKFHSTEVERGRDVAAIWLPPDLAQQIANHKEFLNHNQVNLNPIEPRTPYVFFGYPMGWSGHFLAENHLFSMPLVFSTFEHEGQRDALAFHDPNLHILLNCTRDAVNLQKESIDRLPALKGISGCGIWHVADRGANGLRV